MGMVRHRDLRVVLSTQSEHEGLYSWFLREVGDKEPKYQRDQIPWNWTQYFTLVDITVSRSVATGDRYSVRDEEQPGEVIERSFIRANLLPFDAHGRLFRSSTEYSMFGTNRKISNIELLIYPLESGQLECCAAWGSLSHTNEIDFRDVTFEDDMGFILRLKTVQFDRLACMVNEKSIAGGSIIVHDVEGFYSDWSPSVSTNRIKVLTSDRMDQPVDLPEGCKIVPPRLGKVGEFKLTVFDVRQFDLPSESNDSGDTGVEIHARNEPSQGASSIATAPVDRAMVDVKALDVLKSLRAAAWAIAALLILILLR